MKRLIPLLLLALLAAPAAANAAPRVYAAASLRAAFPEIDSAPTYNFAGSNQLQTQIEHGAPADVFASASPKEAQALFNEGRCTRPVTFATNVVVVLVPRANPAGIRSIYDLDRGARKRIAVGTAGVPIGDYTRLLLQRMRLSSILTRNTVSFETNVANVDREGRARQRRRRLHLQHRRDRGRQAGAPRSRSRAGRSRRSATRCARSSARAPTPPAPRRSSAR